MPTDARGNVWPWTPAQRATLAVSVLVLSACVMIRYAGNRTYIADPQPDPPARFAALQDRIDPNTATEAELAALPTLGLKRARAIVQFRDGYTSTHDGAAAFARPEDLLKIDGIGLAMLEGVLPHLTFPSTRPALPAGSSRL